MLRKHTMQRRAFFYFRDKSFIDDVPETKRADVLPEDDESAAKLVQLKQAVREADPAIPCFDNYPCAYKGLKINWRIAGAQLSESDRQVMQEIAADGIVDPHEYKRLNETARQFVDEQSVVYLDGLQEFGDRVAEQLWEAIQAEHDLPDTPPSETLAETDPLAEEADYHERFMESRLRVYVGRQRDRRDLRRFADGDDEVTCLVSGPAGSGKSALLARFITDYREEHPDVLVVPHFIGASPASAALPGMLRRLCAVLRERFGFELEIPEQEDELPTTFRTYLTLVPSGQRVLLVIDALNQLEEAHQAHELHWLPEQLPPHVKLVVSCTTPETTGPPAQDGHALRPDPAAATILAQLGQRRVFALEVHPLSDAERRQIIHDVPSLSAKALDPTQVGLLLANPATTNPLYLLVALEELRGFGSFEQLNARIEGLPQTGDAVTALFVQVIERLEVEFGQALTHCVLSRLASARRGLSEGELRELIDVDRRGAASQRDGRDSFFPLLRQLRSYLHSRGGLLDFYHRSLALAIDAHYLYAPELKAAAHRSLADYFDRQDLGPRKVDELPWQLAAAGEWQRLYDVLADLSFFNAAWIANQFDVKGYWSRVEASSPLRMVDAYRAVLEEPGRHTDSVWSVGKLGLLLGDTGHPTEAFALRSHLADHFRQAGDRTNLSACLGNQAGILQAQGELDEAMRLHKEEERICRGLGNKHGLSISLGNQAGILQARGELDEAMRLHKEQERICRELGNVNGLAYSLVNQAVLLARSRGQPVNQEETAIQEPR